MNHPAPPAFVLWLTGLSGAGKSTIAAQVAGLLGGQGRRIVLLDGDHLRDGLNADLGYAPADRAENIRRIAHVARLFVQAGLSPLVSAVSPFASDRLNARRILQGHRFVEVFVDVPLEVAERRDPKGLYRQARNGERPHFTGIHSPYEPPRNPDVHVRADQTTPQAAAARILDFLLTREPASPAPVP